MAATTWLLIHLPMSGGLLWEGRVAVLSTDREMDYGRGGLFGGGLGIGYFTLDKIQNANMSWNFRTLPRLASAIILVLPRLSSNELLDDTSVLGIGTALSAFTVIWKTCGGLGKEACFLESWKDSPASEPRGHIHVG